MVELKHQLLDDPARWERILDVMFDTIHAELSWPKPGSYQTARREGRHERIITGTGSGANDILQEAMTDLLQYSADRIRVSWEALAVTIAKNKTKDALRKANKWLGETPSRPRLQLVSGDQPAVKGGDETAEQPSVLDVYPDLSRDPEGEFFARSAMRDLTALAREILSERELLVYEAIQYSRISRAELGRQLGLTGQRVGQLYGEAVEKLEEHPKYPFQDESDH